VFFEFATRYSVNPVHYEEYTVAEMPSARPPDSSDQREVVAYTCGGQYRTGWYRLSDVNQAPRSRMVRVRERRRSP
jgi:hypothetical protein